MMNSQILTVKPSSNFGKSASFTLANRLTRFAWVIVWTVFARWTPGAMNPWRILLLKAFGANVSRRAAIASSARVWLPSNLQMGPFSTLGPGVDCYNMAPISIGTRSVISQRAFLCTGTHDILDPHFQLQARAITISDDVWIAAEAFVAPGVRVFDGGILGARACAFTDVQAWTVYRGNPAVPYKSRIWPSGGALDSRTL